MSSTREFDVLFHWSPSVNRTGIFKNGLVPCMAQPGDRLPYICLGTTPRRAWVLSGEGNWSHEEEDPWDLWSVVIGDTDHLAVRMEEGPSVWEVRVHHPLPPDRLWWVASRHTDVLASDPETGEVG